MTDRRASTILLITMAASLMVRPFVCAQQSPPENVAEAAPVLESVLPRGWQIGKQQTIRLRGRKLDPDLRCISPLRLDNVEVEQVDDHTCRLQFRLADDTRPGFYPVWFATTQGISKPVMISVDRLPQADTDILTLPASVSMATSEQSPLHRFRFQVDSAQTIQVETESARLGLPALFALKLQYDGRELASAFPQPALGGDTRLSANLLRKGEYELTVEDLRRQQSQPLDVRIKFGELLSADAVFPLGLQQGTRRKLDYYRDGKRVDRRWIEAGQQLGLRPAWSDEQRMWTGPVPQVFISKHPELAEGDPLPAPPFGISGRLGTRGQVDQFSFPVKPGSLLRLEVHAQRIGSPIDGVLTVRDGRGRFLGESDDAAGSSDPALDLRIPGDVDRLQVRIRDISGRGGLRHLYRLAVLPAVRGSFELNVTQSAVAIPQGGYQLVPMQVRRESYQDAIEISVVQSPAEITASPALVQAGSVAAVLTLHDQMNEAGRAAALIQLQGRPLKGKEPVVAQVQTQLEPLRRLTPWFASLLPVAVTGPAELELAWNPPATVFTGSEVSVPVEVRRQGWMGPYELSLETAYVPPRKAQQRNGQRVFVSDPNDSLAFSQGQSIAAGAEGLQKLRLSVPGPMPVGAWDCALVATFQNQDGLRKRVVGPSRRIEVQPALQLLIDKIQLPLGEQEQLKITATLQRSGPSKGLPATVELLGTGLPEPPRYVVGGDTADFTWEWKPPRPTDAAGWQFVRLQAVVERPWRDGSTRMTSAALPLSSPD